MLDSEALGKKIEEKARSFLQKEGSRFSFSCLSHAALSKLYSAEEVKRSVDLYGLHTKKEMTESKSSTALGKITFLVSPTSFRDMKTEENENAPHMLAEGRLLILERCNPEREINREECTQCTDDHIDTYAEALASDLGREKDKVILEAFFDTATTNSGKIIEFPKSQCVADDESRLTVEKLMEVRAKLLGANNSHREALYLAVTAEEETELLKLCVENSGVKTLVTMNGANLKNILGFEVVRTEHAPRDSNNKRRIPAWLKSGMHFSIYWGNDVINVSIDDKCYPLVFL